MTLADESQLITVGKSTWSFQLEGCSGAKKTEMGKRQGASASLKVEKRRAEGERSMEGW